MLDHDDALDDASPADSAKLREVHKRALADFDRAVLPQIPVREQALEARRFASIPGAQWDGAWGEQFDNSIKMQVDKIGRGLRKLRNDYRQNRIVPDFRPSGGQSDNDTADTLDGLHRADSNYFKSQQARDNAFEEACTGGFGAYRLTNEWADPLDKDSDEQRVNPGLIIVDADQCVFFDPDSKLYDKSDAKYAFVLTGTSPEAFAEEYGEDKHSSWPDGVERQDYAYDWFRPDTIIVAEYYRVEETTERVLIFTLEATGEEQRHWQKEIDASDIEDMKAQGWEMRSRTAKRRRCRKYVLSGQEVLRDQGFIAGGNIPIAPMYGNRFYIDGVEWFTGFVQSKMDAQRLYNSNVSKLAETNALAPREIPIFAAEQMPPNLAAQWARQNIDRHAFALVNPLIDPVTGQIISAGPIGKVEPPQLQPVAAALLEISNRDLTEDDQEVDQVVANTSADAMDMAAQRVDAKSGVYLDNMRQTVQREGELYRDMACEVYVEPGRVVETMTEDGDDGSATLFEEYRADDGNLKVRNDFANGRYKVIADVTEATTTRRDRTVKQMLHLASVAIQAQDVEGAQAAAGVASLNMDGEGLADYLAWQRQRGIQGGWVKPNEDEQRQMEQAAQEAQQKPDPTMLVAEAQAAALQAGAQKDTAAAGKTVVDTELSKAKIVETLASAADKRAQANLRPIEAANDAEPPEPRIRMGREL